MSTPRPMPSPALLGLARARRTIARMACAGAALAAGVALVRPTRWVATAVIMPSAAEAPGGLGGVAARFGLAVPGADPTRTPEFYADLVRTREVLGPLAAAVVGDAAPVAERDATVRRLRRAIQAAELPRMGAVRIRAHAGSRDSALALSRAVLDAVDRFDRQTRQTRAGAEAAFLAAQVEQAREALRASEDSLVRFLGRNRVRSAPEIAFEQDRLERAVAMRQTLYTSLASALDQARLDQVRNTPRVTVVEAPWAPAKPAPRQVVLFALLGAVAGGCAAAALAVAGGAAAAWAGRAGPQDTESAWAEVAAAVADLRRPWRVVVGRG